MGNRKITAMVFTDSIDTPCIDFSYPQVGLTDKAVQEQINSAIRQLVNVLIPQDAVEDAEGCLVEVTGVSAVTLNEKSILSVRIEAFTFRRMAAHGDTQVRALTFDLRTGRQYQFKDLFDLRSPYRAIISDAVKKQIEAREIPLINEFRSVSDNQEFYLTGSDLVVFFQKYVYTPGYVGVPEFPIPYRTLANVIDAASPLSRLL